MPPSVRSLESSRIEIEASPVAQATYEKKLHCPFPAALHPEVEAIQAHAVAWAVALGLAEGERAALRLDASKVGWLAARANASAARHLVELAADWTTFFCLLDDRIERLDSPAVVAAYLDEVFAALTGARPQYGDSIQGAACDLYERLRLVADNAWLARFAQKNRELFDAFHLEARVRAGGGMVDVQRYVPMREVTVGIWVELELSELAADIELTAGERASMKPMARMACNLVGWANDIYTYEKEMAAGDPNNLVLVLAKSGRSDISSALAKAIRRHDREANELALQIAQTQLSGSDSMRRYATILGNWVRGHLDWARETGRYDG